jgi:hypothetical protein
MTHEEMVVAVTQLQRDRDVALAGVDNFRKFQLDAARKIGFVYGATWIATIVGIVFMAVFGWALSQVVPAAKVVVDEYYANHPAAKIQSNAYTGPVYAKSKSLSNSLNETRQP